jgi:hypothetical protein
MGVAAALRGTVVVLGCGFAAKYRLGGGNFSVPLQWMRGLCRLGLDALWLEILPAGADADEDRRCIAAFERQLAEHGLDRRYCLLYQRVRDESHRLEGMDARGRTVEQLRSLLTRPSILLNLSYSVRPPLLLEFERRILCDLDPAEISYWMNRLEMGQSYHHEFWTVGLNRNGLDCALPEPIVPWKTFYPLVDTELVTPAPRPPRPRFTTIGQWYTLQQVEVDGRWPDLSKRAAFERYLGLPSAAPAAELELAVNIGPDDPERVRLRRHGWALAEPHEVTPTAAAYRAYIAGSLAEFTVCKSGDVLLRTGWLSDRAAAYLATGRPVITEDTRAAPYLPPASGIEWVADLAGAREAVGRVLGDWENLSRQARRTAVEVLDAARNLATILA